MLEEPSSPATHSPQRWTALWGMCLAASLVWLAFADFAVVVPTISRDLAVSLTDLQWANNAFSLAAGALVLAGGKLGDVYGRKRLLLIGVAALGAFSLVPALVPGSAGLTVGRGLMGVAAALVLPGTLALIPPMFPPKEQPRAFGMWMAVAWVAQAAGPALGGVLTSAFGWRSIFWVNLPLALLAYVLVRRAAVESTDPGAGRHVDPWGLLSSAGAAFLLLYACTAGQEYGFSAPFIIALFCGAVVLGALFVLSAKRVRDPLVDLSLFRLRPFSGALTANFTMNFAFGGVSFLLALYLQEVRGYSALVSGLLLLPSIVTILLFNPIGGKIARRFGPRLPVRLGVVLLGAGTVVAGVAVHDYHYWVLVLGLLLLGCGLGIMSIPLSDTAVAGPPEELAGTASGLFKVTSMLGGSFGVAVLVAVQQELETRQAVDKARAAGLSEDQVDELGNAVTDSELYDKILAGVDEATRNAITAAYQEVAATGTGRAVFAAGLLCIVAGLALPLIWRRERKRR
ncbi:MFS transporter [Streptomyces bambusae]|uniref:MFS transporter n=1 Tax=Streptomyces bambusae TaxID=1550616 RepID=UPI001CFF84EB|nr:MFS transporter [Streptomyces bambusae]MCB5169150.1 MFS transporter [Streptomyces bambusae]